jgi:hypothetical protein
MLAFVIAMANCCIDRRRNIGGLEGDLSFLNKIFVRCMIYYIHCSIGVTMLNIINCFADSTEWLISISNYPNVIL